MLTNVVCFCFVLKIKWRLPPDWRERLSTNEFVFVLGEFIFVWGGMIALFYFYQADFRGPMPKTNCVFNNYLINLPDITYKIKYIFSGNLSSRT